MSGKNQKQHVDLLKKLREKSKASCLSSPTPRKTDTDSKDGKLSAQRQTSWKTGISGARQTPLLTNQHLKSKLIPNPPRLKDTSIKVPKGIKFDVYPPKSSMTNDDSDQITTTVTTESWKEAIVISDDDTTKLKSPQTARFVMFNVLIIFFIVQFFFCVQFYNVLITALLLLMIQKLKMVEVMIMTFHLI